MRYASPLTSSKVSVSAAIEPLAVMNPRPLEGATCGCNVSLDHADRLRHVAGPDELLSRVEPPDHLLARTPFASDADQAVDVAFRAMTEKLPDVWETRDYGCPPTDWLPPRRSSTRCCRHSAKRCTVSRRRGVG